MELRESIEFKKSPIGQIPKTWEVFKLEDYVEIKGRIGWKGLKVSEYTMDGPFIVGGLQIIDGKVLWNACAHVSQKRYDESPEIKLQQNDILITKDGTIGKLAYVAHVPGQATIASHIHLIRSKSNRIIQKFLFYYFNSPKFHSIVEGKISGSVISALTQADINKAEFPLPPINEQKAIAKILSDLDSKIELNQKMNKTLEAIAQAIFRHWFIDFEFPNENGKPYKSSGGEMVDSELGEIPKGWKIGRIKDIAKVKSGKRPIERSELKTETFSVELIGASSVMGYTNDYLFSENLVIIGRVGTHGVIQRTFRPSWPSDNTLVFITRNLEYIFQVLKRVEYEALNVGSTQPLITQSQMENFEIIIPSKTILDVFENLSMIIYKKISTTNVESENLSSILSLLLPRLMTGKIRVPLEE